AVGVDRDVVDTPVGLRARGVLTHPDCHAAAHVAGERLDVGEDHDIAVVRDGGDVEGVARLAVDDARHFGGACRGVPPEHAAALDLLALLGPVHQIRGARGERDVVPVVADTPEDDVTEVSGYAGRCLVEHLQLLDGRGTQVRVPVDGVRDASY